MKLRISFLFALILFTLSTVAATAQVNVKGKVLEKGTDNPLGGVRVSVGSTGSISNRQGEFTLSVPENSTLLFRYMGYLDKKVKIGRGPSVDLGAVYMEEDVRGIEDVVVIASIIPKDRITPVPVSNVSIDVIETKAPNIEFPELLKQTPSVYVTKGGGGFGDSRINMRGFDSNNLGILINGVPINDMESGKVYWSNWAGLSDVSSFIQIQRGLGASKLGLSSVGGTMNMVTKSTDAKKGGSFYTGIGNDGYSKMAFNVSTGLMDNGWAVSLAGARTSGDGYVRGTAFQGWSYFVNISKIINEDHRLSFTAFGAPQWHNQRGTMYTIEDIRESGFGARHNIGYGYINGQEVGGAYGRNFYHKPQMSLNHYWEISPKSKLSTSLYASLARGGGRRVRGAEGTNWLGINNTTGKPSNPLTVKQTPEGLLDFDAVMRENRASDNGSKAIFSNGMNSHNWYGILSSFNHKLSDALSLTAGYDARFYQGLHYEQIENLLGGDYYVEPQTSARKLMYHKPNQPLKVGDRIEYDNIGEVLWNGIFAQAEAKSEKLNGFVSASLSNQAYRYVNLGGTNEKAPLAEGQSRYVSEWASYLPWSVKSGLSYKLNNQNNFFVNAGYFTRAPYFRSVFFNYNTEINTGAKYERVLTGEIGYGFISEVLKVDVNAYYTKWMDKGITRRIGNNELANITGLNARHMGVELEATYKPTKRFELKGMVSVGDWIWTDDVNAAIFNESQQKIAEIQAFIAGVHVGNSAQVTASLSSSYEVFKNFRIYGNLNYAGKNFADFDPTNRTKESDKVDAWQLPNYYTLDLGANYKFNIGSLNATLYMNVDNATNVEYIADARDGKKHDMKTSLVYFGFGRTWATGLRINF